MNWYYIILGGHTHVRVFMNGGKCGDLCFRNEEFVELRRKFIGMIMFNPDNVDQHRAKLEKNWEQAP